MDPGEGPANHFAVSGGLSRTEIERVIGSIAQAMPIRGVALTAFDPSIDPSGRAREAAMELSLAMVNAARYRSPHTTHD